MSDLDGRTVRREKNLTAVLDAAIALFAEDNLSPRPEDVAQRSGVSLRSVYRYFSDTDELLQAAIERHLEKITPLMRVHEIGQGPLDDRIERFVEARLALYEAIGAVARAAQAAAGRNPTIKARTEQRHEVLRGQIVRHFAPELKAMTPTRRRAVTDGIDALFQLEGHDHLRRNLGHSRARTAEIQRDLLRLLLA